MPLSAIVASTPDGIIGADQAMPWQLSSDLKRFKRLTMGHTLLMGRKTFDSIGRVLPGRSTVVLTRNPAWSFPEVQTITDPDEVFPLAESQHVFVVGGGEIYRLLLPHCEQLWWTKVWASLSGDTRVDLPLDEFRVYSHTTVPVTEKDQFPTECFHLVRRSTLPSTLPNE